MVRPPSRGRWAGTRRRPPKEATTSKLYEKVLANDALETKIQNDMSPFPPTYTEHVSRRDVAEDVYRDGACALPMLRDIALRVAGKHFSTHILPTPEVLEELSGATPRRPPPRKRRRGDEDDYTPEDADEVDEERRPKATRTLVDAMEWSEMNRELLKHMPVTLVDRLFEMVCLYSPMSVTKEVLSSYFLPHVAPDKTKSTPGAVPPLPAEARVRTRIFFPASLPLFSQDHKTAPLLLAMLAGALALSPSAPRLTAPIEAVELHGLTRLQNASFVRLLRAPPSSSLPVPWQLRRVSVRGCLALGDAAVAALVRASGATLEHFDLTMTSASPAALREIGLHCPQLRAMRVAWCENFTEETFSEAVSACVAQCAHANPPCIPFQTLEEVDVSHTSVGDIAVGGLLRLCGPQLRSLDVGYTAVGESGSLDVLCIGLGLGVPRSAARTASPLAHIGLAGLCVHSSSMLHLVRQLLPVDGTSALRSLDLDDLVEYARRHQSSLQGRMGVSGPTLHALATMLADAAQHRPFACVRLKGDKRRAAVPGHWAVPDAPAATLGDTLRLLFASCEQIELNGLQLHEHDLDCSVPHAAPSVVHTLWLNSTGLRDDGLDVLVPWTGRLTSLYLDDTQITSTYCYSPSRGPRPPGRIQSTPLAREPVAVPWHSRPRTPRLFCSPPPPNPSGVIRPFSHGRDDGHRVRVPVVRGEPHIARRGMGAST